jgi:hypothetical protein
VIAAYENELGRALTSAERTAVAKVAVLKTRPGKNQVDIVGLIERWHTEAAELGWAPDRVLGSVCAADHASPAQLDVEQLILEAVRSAGARKAIFTRSDLAAEVAARVPAGSAVDAARILDWVQRLTDRALAISEVVELLPERDGPVRASDARYASATTLAQEAAIVSFAEHAVARVRRSAPTRVSRPSASGISSIRRRNAPCTGSPAPGSKCRRWWRRPGPGRPPRSPRWSTPGRPPAGR